MTELLDKDTDLPLSAGEDDMRQFLREIRTFPRLTAEEEKELARRCAAGGRNPPDGGFQSAAGGQHCP